MSRCWGYTEPIADAFIGVEDYDDIVGLEISYPDRAEVSASLTEGSARMLRDWLSWWLGDGPEPGENQ